MTRASVLDERTRPLRNLVPRPRMLGVALSNPANGTYSSDDEWHIITPNASSTGADAFLSLANSWIDLIPGKVYTLMGRARIYGGQFGGSQTNSIWVYIGGAFIGSTQAPGVNVPGEFDLRLAFVVPQSTTGLTTVRLYSGRTAPTAWTNIMLVEGDYRGGYADGDSPGWAWSGARGNSVSAGQGLVKVGPP